MNKLDVINDIQIYLNKKKFDLKIIGISDNNILFNYIFNNYNFIINLTLSRCNDDIMIYYSSNYDVMNIKQHKNCTSSKNYCKNVYNNLNYIKTELFRFARRQQKLIDDKNKYCNELISYYEKIHKCIKIDISENNSIDNKYVDIKIIGSDNDTITTYDIIYIDNKYYMINKFIDFITEKLITI